MLHLRWRGPVFQNRTFGSAHIQTAKRSIHTANQDSRDKYHSPSLFEALLASPSNSFALIEQFMIVYVTMFSHCLFRSKGRGQLIGSCPKDGTYRTWGKWWPWGERKQQGPPKEKNQERKLWKTSKDWLPCRERWCFSERAEQPGQHVFLQRCHSSRIVLHRLNSLTCLDVVIDVVFLSRVFHKHTS